MGVAERRAREKEELREKILEAASRLFVAEGADSLSMRRIAERIEYSPSTIYLYFKDKDELLGTICQETFLQLRRQLDQVVSRESDPLDALRAGLRCYIAFGLEHPHHYFVTFGLPGKAKRLESWAPALEAGHHCFDSLRQGLGQAMAAGRIRQTDLETLSLTTWMFLHGVVSVILNATDPKVLPASPKLDVVTESVEQVIRSLGPLPPGQPEKA